MFHDVGMLKVPRSIRMADRKLTEEEQFEVERHPIYTINALEQIKSLSPTSLIVRLPNP